MNLLNPSLVAVIVATLFSVSISAHDDPTTDVEPESLGNVRFVTSCHQAVRNQFNSAVSALHSFWFSEAIKVFDSVLKADPQCAMAYWGLGMSYWGYRRQLSAMRAGLAAVEKAEAVLDPCTDAARVGLYRSGGVALQGLRTPQPSD